MRQRSLAAVRARRICLCIAQEADCWINSLANTWKQACCTSSSYHSQKMPGCSPATSKTMTGNLRQGEYADLKDFAAGQAHSEGACCAYGVGPLEHVGVSALGLQGTLKLVKIVAAFAARGLGCCASNVYPCCCCIAQSENEETARSRGFSKAAMSRRYRGRCPCSHRRRWSRHWSKRHRCRRELALR